MTYEIELFLPSALPGAGALTETLGPCKIITKNVFVTVTEQSGEARLMLLDELAALDRSQGRLVTVLGKTCYPRRIDLPAKIFVETASGHARAVGGDQIARLTLVRRQGAAGARIAWR